MRKNLLRAHVPGAFVAAVSHAVSDFSAACALEPNDPRCSPQRESQEENQMGHDARGRGLKLLEHHLHAKRCQVIGAKPKVYTRRH